MQNKKVLVVDDSSTIRTAVKWIPSGQDIDVLVAEDGQQGVDAATRELPELMATRAAARSTSPSPSTPSA
jgi:DNA-binding response OmpR family regulator